MLKQFDPIREDSLGMGDLDDEPQQELAGVLSGWQSNTVFF